ncbi:MAG: ABC transporter ATP-binding protein [Chloroflexi bacterium]|nr:ABC transporter ATP-binding protein [Chloroflexota bacterium]
MNEIAVSARNVTRIYGSGDSVVRAISDVSLEVARGEWIGVKGRSGSGKTTLLNCLSGLDRPTSGEIVCFGRDIARLSESQMTEWRRNQVSFIFQSFALMPTLSAFENVDLPMRIAGMPKRRERVVECLEMVGMEKWADHRPYEMSGGQQQRVALARALANRPSLLIADEPTGELDTNTSKEILALLRRIVIAENVTVLMSSHDPLALESTDRVVELRDGRTVGSDGR